MCKPGGGICSQYEKRHPIKVNSIAIKPMIKMSRYWQVSQRAAAGGKAVYRKILNGLVRAAQNREGVDADGNSVRYQQSAYDGM